MKSVTYRKIRSVNIKVLRENLTSSELIHNITNNTNLDALVDNYNFTLSMLVDSHTPLSANIVKGHMYPGSMMILNQL